MNLSLNSGINFANDMDNTNEIEMFSPEEMQSPFEAIKETDGNGITKMKQMVASSTISSTFRRTKDLILK